MKKIIFCFVVFIFLLAPTITFARIGVGVATGKIIIDEKLAPGIIYNLPPLTVVNTGDVTSDYEVTVTYFEKQAQLKPPTSWFIFSPQHFNLKPGAVQVVNIKLNLPVAVTPGDYFGFLEAHPLKKSRSGQTIVGIAAATKLYFTIIPANIFYGIYYKIISFWNIYAPWPEYGSLIILFCIIVLFMRKFLNIEIGLKKTKVEKTEHHNENKTETKNIDSTHNSNE